MAVTRESTLQIPVIYNPKKIDAKTLLVVLDDLNLIKISKSLKDAKEATKEAPARGSGSGGPK